MESPFQLKLPVVFGCVAFHALISQLQFTRKALSAPNWLEPCASRIAKIPNRLVETWQIKETKESVSTRGSLEMKNDFHAANPDVAPKRGWQPRSRSATSKASKAHETARKLRGSSLPCVLH